MTTTDSRQSFCLFQPFLLPLFCFRVLHIPLSFEWTRFRVDHAQEMDTVCGNGFFALASAGLINWPLVDAGKIDDAIAGGNIINVEESFHQANSNRFSGIGDIENVKACSISDIGDVVFNFHYRCNLRRVMRAYERRVSRGRIYPQSEMLEGPSQGRHSPLQL